MSATTNLTTRIPERQSPFRREIFIETDFPAPIANVINLEDFTDYRIKDNVVITTGIQVKYGIQTRITGLGDTLSTITGNTTLPFFITGESSPAKGTNVAFTQNGTGRVMDIDTPGSVPFFLRCQFNGGEIRMISGFAITFELCNFENGAFLVQSGTDVGIDDINLTFSAWITVGDVVDAIVFETGSFASKLTIRSGAGFAFFDGSTGIKIEQGASIVTVRLISLLMILEDTDAVVIDVEDPASVGNGTLDSGSLIGTGSLLVCNPISNASFAAPASLMVGITQDNPATGTGNILLASESSGLIYKMVGVSATEDSNINPAAGVGLLVWHMGDLYVAGPTVVTRYDGFSISVVASVTLSATLTGVTFIGNNLVTVDSSQTVSIHDGFSTVVLSSFVLPSPITSTFGLTFDGVNLLVGERDAGDDMIFVLKGATGVIQYSFVVSGLETVSDISLIYNPARKDVGFAVLDESANDEFQTFDHAVTFDHSSRTWEIKDIAAITSSSDRGGSEFSGDATEISNVDTLGDWEDITATGLFYSLFEQNEKVVLNDETTGEVIFIGVRENACTIGAQVSITRPAGGGGVDRFYQITITIDDVVIGDSIVQDVLPDASTFATLTTVPVARQLDDGTRIRIQIRQVAPGGVVAPEVLFVKLSIT